MAYVNVKDWSVEQVTEWLKGLDSVITPYTKSFLNNEVKGHQLLSLRSDDLEHLGVLTLGHQEIILEAVEHLRNFHYKLDKENLQMLALRLSCAANSLCKELSLTDDNCTMVPTQTMSDVHNVITAIKPLVCWLDRSPFRGDKDYVDCKTQLLQLSFEMATSAHRDIFSEKPLRSIRNISNTLAKLADHIIQEMSDPMILQPASLALATLKKKEQELGFFLLPSNYAIHQIAEIKFGSPAHNSSKIEEGDEIVQVNYQTVVGWQRKNVLLLLQESPPEIVLTLKKRPRHTKVYGQIYMKPYRLPSKKRATPYSRWNDNLPSPQLLAIPDLPQIPPPRLPPVVTQPEIETEISSSSDSEPLDSPLDGGGRVYPLKPRPVLQRRNTITGASPTSKRPHQAIEQYWQQLKNQAASKHSSSYNIQSNKYEDESTLLRDKSVSCSNGFELAPRPTTVIGISHNKSSANADFKKRFQDKSFKKKKVNFDMGKFTQEESQSTKTETNSNYTEVKDLNFCTNLNEEHSVSVNSLTSLNEQIDFIDEGVDITDRSNMKSEWQKEIVEELIDTINFEAEAPKVFHNGAGVQIESDASVTWRDSPFADVHVHNIIKKFDGRNLDINLWDPKNAKPKVFPKNIVEKPPELPQKPDFTRKPVVPPKNIKSKIRGTLNKSYSTPAYDQSSDPANDAKFLPEKNLLETQFKKPLQSIRDVEEPKNNSLAVTNYNAPIKYELGIPIVEKSSISSPTLYLEQNQEKSSAENSPDSLMQKNHQDIPPKPPPRLLYTSDSSKYKNSSSSPKRFTQIECQNTYSDNTAKDLVPHGVVPSVVDLNSSTLTQSFHSIDSNSSLTATTVLLRSPEHYPGSAGLVSLKYAGSSERVDSFSFDPRSVSTPVTKQKMEFPDVDFAYSKSPSSLETGRIASDTKISPTNSIVRAMMYSSKSKTGKKKNTLIAKRRKVSVKDVIPGELQGYLYQRSRSKQSQPAQWEKRWFVLNGSCLYGFESKDASKAKCLIFLSGFTVSLAAEVKSRSNAFKVYHTGTVFYFSADDSETLTSWIELMTAATFMYDSQKLVESVLYSESDESDVEKNKSGTLEKGGGESVRKFGSLKKATAGKNNASAQSSGSSSLDRKWFFNKSNGIYKNSLPVPTAQFTSYRKQPSSISVTGSMSTGNFTSHIPDFSPRFDSAKPGSIQQSHSTSNLAVTDAPKKPDSDASTSKSKTKHKPLNYVHASNPNLCEVSDFHLRSFHKLQPFQPPCTDNLAGFVTLEELMNRQTEEQKLNPHGFKENPVPINPNYIRADVVYGELPIRPSKEMEANRDKQPMKKPTHSRTISDCSVSNRAGVKNSPPPVQDELNSSKQSNDSTSFCFGKRGSLKKQKKDRDAYDVCTYPKSRGFDEKLNRSLPRTHKLPEPSPTGETIPAKLKKQSRHYSSGDRKTFTNKEYSVSYVDLKDHSSEMVYCPQTLNDVHFAQNRTLDGKNKSGKIVRQHSLTSVDKKERGFVYGTSTEKLWIDSLRRSDKVSDKSCVKLKSAVQYTPMSLPLVPDQKGKLNPKFAFELNLDEKVTKAGKFKHFFAKQTESKKEKTFLGSPKLHRAVFEKHGRVESNPLGWPPDPAQLQSSHTMDNCYSLEESSTGITRTEVVPSLHTTPTIDYPGLEYPPVFEPETYSLSDPQCSITLLRKQDKNN